MGRHGPRTHPPIHCGGCLPRLNEFGNDKGAQSQSKVAPRVETGTAQKSQHALLRWSSSTANKGEAPFAAAKPDQQLPISPHIGNRELLVRRSCGEGGSALVSEQGGATKQGISSILSGLSPTADDVGHRGRQTYTTSVGNVPLRRIHRPTAAFTGARGNMTCS